MCDLGLQSRWTGWPIREHSSNPSERAPLVLKLQLGNACSPANRYESPGSQAGAWEPECARRRVGRVFASILAGLLVIACVARTEAHEVDVFASVDGRSISGRAKMMGGSPIKSARVTAFDPAGDILAETVTDDSGEFTFPLEFRCGHRIEVDAGEGHLGRHTVEVAELPTDLPPRGPQSERATPTSAHDKAESGHSSADAHSHSHPDSSHNQESQEDRLDAIDRQLQALRRDIDQFQARLRIQDIVGAVGYILGLMGLAYYLGVKRKEKAGNDA